jgi:hypothetical protein
MKQKNELSKTQKVALVAASSLVGLGFAAAMMPIVNRQVKHLDEYGLDVHENNYAFTISTLNTLLFMGTFGTRHLYKYCKEKLSNKPILVPENISAEEYHEDWLVKDFEPQYIKLTKFIAPATSTLVPLYLLWSTELLNQKEESSHGFDQYITWATFATLPLFLTKYTIAQNGINKLFKKLFDNENNDPQIELTLGGKIVVYGTDTLAMVARGITLYTAIHETLKAITGDKEELNDILKLSSAILGGLIINGIHAFKEHSALKELFTTSTNNITKTDALIGAIHAIESGWFSLPEIGLGLSAIKDANPLLKAALFCPMWLSATAKDANNTYKALKLETESQPLQNVFLEDTPLTEHEVKLCGEEV